MTNCRINAWVLALLLPHAAVAADLQVTFTDPVWDGVTVPKGHQCHKFGGTHGSPALRVSGIPEGANALILEFSDRSYSPMDNGGHGKVGYEFDAGSTTVAVPSVPPHTFDLPAGFWTVAAHGAPKWDKPGAYLPPCSGGKGNEYYVTVKAVVRKGESVQALAQTALEMGRF